MPFVISEAGWLTADFVERVHKAHLRGKPVADHIANLTYTTLAGLIEYGCLRSAVGGLPELPAAIKNSELGRNLNAVVSVMGLRQSGWSTPPTVSHEPRDVEFVVIRDIDDLLSEPIQMLFMRATQAAKQAVARDFKKVGIIDGEGGNVLRKALIEPSSPSIAELRVLSICEITGEATAEIVRMPNQ